MKSLVISVLILLSSFSISFAASESKYSETTDVLQESYNGEVMANRKYLAYAKKAESENYPNIAYLFISLASSEAIHAKNFKEAASNLGVELEEPLESPIEISNTKTNLKNAVKAELQEIDHKYPDFIDKIKTEGCEPAIQYITFAWEAEKQHRDLIQKVSSNIGLFFGTIAKKIEASPTKYFVCQICGSTTIEIPKDICPVCKGPISAYIELKKGDL